VLTGFAYDSVQGRMLIAGTVPTSSNCIVLGMAESIRRGFLVMTNSDGK
jgi:hypothetical protein